MCPDQKLCREEPQNRQAKPHKQICVFTGAAASLGEWCKYINLRVACNIAQTPEVLCQKINYESSTSEIFLGKVYIRKLVLLSRTDLLRAVQLCTSCVQVLEAVTFMPTPKSPSHGHSKNFRVCLWLQALLLRHHPHLQNGCSVAVESGGCMCFAGAQ